MLVKVATTGVSLYKSFKDVRVLLVQIQECVSVGNEAIVEKLDHLVTIFLNLFDGSSLNRIVLEIMSNITFRLALFKVSCCHTLRILK
jgi:hypothetical protein